MTRPVAAADPPEPPGRGLSGPPATLKRMEPVWSVRPEDPRAPELSRALGTEAGAGIPRVIASLLLSRGAQTAEEARAFLHPDPDALHDPDLLLGATEAADVLVSAARSGRRIVVFGDYDVDGVTSVAQLRAALLRAGADAVAFLPHRLKDGYGLRPDTVRRVLEELRPGVLITVDCGITAIEGVACAREAGVDVIVTDHHLVPQELPAGAIVVNPRQPGCPYPEKELAACGIAMKLAQAVARRAGVSLSREALLRAAALGTIADLVPLRGENRTIAALGLAALANPRAPGLRALLREAGVAEGRPPTSEQIAFRVAPRLNAAGRLDTAELALALFEERDPTRACEIAHELSTRNSERQTIERRVVGEARERIERECDAESDAVIVLAAPDWHRGVLGIAASRLAREYHRPVLLFSLEDGRARGSGRSIPGVSLHGLLTEIGGLFDEFGGHEQAVGGSLPAGRVDELREAARALFARRIPASLLRPVSEADAELSADGVTPELLGWLERLEPHGMGNPRPVFAGRIRASRPFRALGQTGVRGRLARETGGDLECLSWSPGCLAGAVRGDEFEAHFRVTRGRDGAAEAEIVAARPAAGADRPRAGRAGGAAGGCGFRAMTRRRLVELAVVLFGAAFLFYLATSFQPGRRPGTSTRRSEKIPAPPDGTEPGQPTTVLKGFDYTETVRGKPLFHIKSERTIGFGAAAGLLPNLYALEKVTLTVYPETGAPVTVNSEKATYDQRTNEAHLNGNVRWVDGRGALGETEELAFQPSARLLTARKPVRLTRGTFVLEARSGVYDVAKREARLEGPIHGSGTGEGTGGLTSFDADHGVYHRDESTMELAGSVSALSAQGDRMQADQVVLKTGEEGQHLQWARAEGNVHGTIAASSLPQGAGGAAAGKARSARTYHGDRGGLIFGPDGSMRSLSLSGNPATVEEPTRKLRASTIDVSFDQGHARSAKAVGAVKIESEDSRGESNEATMELTPAGEMASLEMTGAVHMEGEGRSGRADKAVQVADRNVWILTADPGRSATVEGDGSKVSASRIELDQKNRGLRAEGTARAVLTPRHDGQKLASPVGDGSKPTFGKAERITVDDASRVATLSGNATLWQDASSVFGNDITVNDRERTLVAVGNTRSVFTPANSDKPGSPTPAPAAAPPRPESPPASHPPARPRRIGIPR